MGIPHSRSSSARADAVAPALCKEVGDEILPFCHGGGVQVVDRQLTQQLGGLKGGGHGIAVVVCQALGGLNRHFTQLVGQISQQLSGLLRYFQIMLIDKILQLGNQVSHPLRTDQF